ncbi:Predicted ATP-binding protein involved in virulence [Serratia entomophila]|uniref:AAA family ATPase n=1 Tax=Serratia entomophila TaxID=42906 RepID=UPI002177F7DC|nr:AAA family ATPase [Serratia entomophila]CAI1047308.1 Predicted ATP-binding protein involved in virulence [Serratia entomophila]CAI1051221.1 Predicted ATP-binding protein involved in virulence [Serratia entomophila]CAI1063485.1 Predicted ATP-binding protein involved in virulence [Serratia entomophila]CAI1728892.1 Predicted ATP-binding protein involved in virulence [Serratia entomophila]CAI1790895.1 Predicted ATP-binding protein involved in virulence [Serratia entomophila]
MNYEKDSKSNYLLKRVGQSYENRSVVILGQNGEGKSRLLVDLIDRADDYSYKNVIAVSTSPFDKFPIRKKYNFITYNYVGVKGGGTGNSILSLISSASLGLLDQNKNNDRHIERILSFLGASSEVEYVFKVSQRVLNYYYLDSSHEDEIISSLGLGLGEKKIDLSYNDLESIKWAAEFLSFSTDSNKNFKVGLKIGGEAYLKSKRGQANNINADILTLLKFDLIKLIDFRIEKKSFGWMSLRLASSGEQCILLSLLGIATNICNNSLILIDEPEISLHPEWQEKYISLLMRIFERYNSCLFVIATHSPQVVSKLDPFRSYIYTIKNDELVSASEYVKKSSDFQLANLFLAPGYKNEYLTRELITFLTSPKEYMEGNKAEEIRKIISLSENLDPLDPVFKLIEIARKVIAEI